LTPGDRLRQLADTITAEPADAKAPHAYPFSYLRSQRWDRVTMVVARTDEAWWRAANGSGRSDRRILAERGDLTRMPTAAEQRKLAAARVETDLFPEPGRLAGVVPEPVPSDQTTLTAKLYEENPPENGPISLLVGICDLARAHYLNRDVRATTLRMLATIPTLVHDKPTRDLLGRAAEQFHLDTGDQRDTILLDPRTGRLLAHQQNVLTSPPALFTHVLYLTADRVARCGDVPRSRAGS
jgi:hypothetical protein